VRAEGGAHRASERDGLPGRLEDDTAQVRRRVRIRVRVRVRVSVSFTLIYHLEEE